ncbi:hypothetical protein B0H11DRAFT_2322162 [Mycena galericulata]|nr:hypothetical protein B0H11DRAFT_2322162 [Mycena galericulata]
MFTSHSAVPLLSLHITIHGLLPSSENGFWGGTLPISSALERERMATLEEEQNTFETEEESHSPGPSSRGDSSRWPDQVPLSSDPNQNFDVPQAESRSGMASRASIAAEFLGSIRTSIPHIVDLLKDNDSDVREAGAAALLKLSEQAEFRGSIGIFIPQIVNLLKDCHSDTKVTLHILSAGCTEDFSGWPRAIHSIYSILGLPLPSWCATGPHLLPCTEQPRLADVFNLVVSAVTDIQSLVALYGPSRPATPFVLPLLRILARICAQEAMTITEAPFVRARIKTPDSDDFDGVATMLACHVIERDVPLPSSEGSTLASETAYPGASSSDAGSDPSPFFNGPLGAHILPGRGVHACAALPFLCVADPDNIADLMASVACAVMTLVLSWVDPATSTVHITSSASNGVFDLTDTASALSLAQFVLNLSSHFASVLERAKERSKLGFENNSLNWRSDNILPSDESGDWRDRVVQWLRHVEMPSSPLSLPTASPSTDMPPHKASQKSAGEKSTTSQSEKLAAKSASEAQSEPKRKSSSSYAGRTIGDLAEPEGQLLTWMFDRSVQTIARIRFSGDDLSEEKEDINKKIALYDAMCALCRPADKVTFPPVDAVLSSERDRLIEGLKAANPPSTLSPSEQKTLFGRLSGLLSAATGAYTMRAKHYNVPVYEAESRHDWDALLYHFYCQDTDIVSPYVMLEHTIHYPRNDLADEIISPAFDNPDEFKKFIFNRWKGRLSKRLDLCQAAERAAQEAAALAALEKKSPDGLEGLIHQLAQAATKQTDDVNTIWLGYLDEPTALRRLIAERSDAEPAQGTTDAILFMAIHGKSDLSKKIGIIQHGKPSGSAPDEGAALQGSASGDGAPSARSTKTVSAKATSEEGKQGAAGSQKGIPVVVRRINDSRLENLFAVNPPRPPPVPHNGLPPLPLTSFKDDLLLPHAVVEYKKHSHSDSKGLNQGRFYLISVVSFYAALGIVDRPFYGLVTSGDRGAILMAWKSKPESELAKRAEIYIMERNVCRMDISNPSEAFQFATFLIRLREDQNELKKLVEEKLGGDLDVERLARWRKLAQPRLIPVKEKEEDSAQGQTAPATTSTTRLILTPLPEVGESPT